jgi:glycosyltransferase involved in cell wall biosynthesis
MSLVSILIPCYNAERWIAQCIESALAQTWPNKEVIVVDDGSTDGSLDVIRSFGDRIRWETGPNRGGNVARNRLLELAGGEWLQYLDADDYLLPEKIAGQMQFLATHPETDVVFGPITIEHCMEGRSRLEPLPIPEPHDPWVLLALWHLPQTGSPLWRKSALQSVGGWKPLQPCCQEHELYLRLLKADMRFSILARGGAVYRRWGEHTVCRRNPILRVQKRLEIMTSLEEHLDAMQSLTPSRCDAIGSSRLECLRLLYKYDPALAKVVAHANLSDNWKFRIPKVAQVHWAYRIAFHTFGFYRAEQLADHFRPLLAAWRWTKAVANYSSRALFSKSDF